MENKEIISIDSKAFNVLVDRIISYLSINHSFQQDEWVSSSEAMRLLNITSPTTLSALRNTGKIKFSQPMHKVILYNRQSILEYIELHSKETF